MDTHAAILFPANALPSQGVRGKYVSLRTIAQDLTSFLKTFWPFWLLMGSTQIFGFNIPAGRNFHPQKTGGFWEGQFSAVPKFYGTRPPPLIQSCYNIDIESSRYSGGDNKKQLVKISDIVLKHWLKNFDDSSSSKINSDKNPSTEITKPPSACNGWFQINRREIRFGLGFSWLGFGFQSLRAKVSSACAFT